MDNTDNNQNTENPNTDNEKEIITTEYFMANVPTKPPLKISP